MSSISTIGLGNMVSVLADRALAGDNAVEIIGRDPAKAKELAAALGSATVRPRTPEATARGKVAIRNQKLPVPSHRGRGASA
ncbi:NAD(P)-binding domain-containing protein [Streptomyces brasiliensis]|uniref:Pyrroline-5-carboxylate reductase catalytic N-terminal domain-containing protein n=1 Tax=Streptomyces brasiliensis TaxID=1954 RepID=A0A917LCQ0_9ACTN|nr:NAD(P)-binding domain-containing protein [Streptomyces brasiliensis]GGJ58462.1 hypothetical protein GCM10010121_081410 [Streptomyces brasiliensis]